MLDMVAIGRVVEDGAAALGTWVAAAAVRSLDWAVATGFWLASILCLRGRFRRLRVSG